MLEFESGQKAIINFNSTYRSDNSISCAIKWVDNDRLCIVFPQDKKEFIRELPEGKEIEVVIYTNSGIFAFESIVMNSPLEHDFVIELPEDHKKVQRREYIRAPISLDFAIKREESKYKTRTINVGGGGIRFVTQDKLKIGDLWKFSLDLPDGKEVEGLGKVLYTLLQGKNIVSVLVFTDINETDRNRLIKLCLDEEIKSLKYRRQG